MTVNIIVQRRIRIFVLTGIGLFPNSFQNQFVFMQNSPTFYASQGHTSFAPWAKNVAKFCPYTVCPNQFLLFSHMVYLRLGFCHNFYTLFCTSNLSISRSLLQYKNRTHFTTIYSKMFSLHTNQHVQNIIVNNNLVMTMQNVETWILAEMIMHAFQFLLFP